MNIKCSKSTRVINVLCVSDYFIPGYLGGGPITTLFNMRKQLFGEVNFFIFTRDRDLGVDAPYFGIQANQWLETPEGCVYYACPDFFGPRGLRKALDGQDFDIFYLNSFFSPSASIFLYLFLQSFSTKRRILLAPRGEFSPGALSIKKYKKKLFLAISRIFGLYNDVFWHASTINEAKDISRTMPTAKNRIYIAADPVVTELIEHTPFAPREINAPLRMVFVSRISPMKNLDGLLQALMSVTVAVELDIFGPIEDEPYWELCKESISELPVNIFIRVHGSIAPRNVSGTFGKFDLFAFPTKGENFGHVIFESLRAGTPVLVSDQTPWCPDAGGALTVIPLHETTAWCEAIVKAAQRTKEEQEHLRKAARSYAIRYANESNSRKENIEMFTKILTL